MTFTYSVGSLSTNYVMQVRRLIGDTVDSGHLFEDEEIQFYLDTNRNNIYYAAGQCLYSLSAKYSSLVDKQIGDLRIRSSEKAKSYLASAERMFAQGRNNVLAYPVYGAMSKSSKDTNRQDTDIVQPSFTVDMMERSGDESITRTLE